MENMTRLDRNDKKILSQIIRNPRISDNAIAKNTGLAVKTINRKRKAIENAGILTYIADIDNFRTEVFNARYMFRIRFRLGITRKFFSERYREMPSTALDSKHIRESMIGEEEGHLVLILILESRNHDDMLEIYNSEIVPKINDYMGHDAIIRTDVTKLTRIIRQMHNYMPERNMKAGCIKDEWPEHLVFVSD